MSVRDTPQASGTAIMLANSAAAPPSSTELISACT
jgi:hypothetical protein